jgi:hypothetical protein
MLFVVEYLRYSMRLLFKKKKKEMKLNGLNAFEWIQMGP